MNFLFCRRHMLTFYIKYLKVYKIYKMQLEKTQSLITVYNFKHFIYLISNLRYDF